MVNCEANAFSLAIKLFANIPGFQTTYTCNNGCPSRTLEEISFSLPNAAFLGKESGNAITSFLTLDRMCTTRGCGGVVKLDYTGSGNILFSFNASFKKLEVCNVYLN